jgi:hypothetical protein
MLPACSVGCRTFGQLAQDEHQNSSCFEKHQALNTGSVSVYGTEWLLHTTVDVSVLTAAASGWHLLGKLSQSPLIKYSQILWTELLTHTLNCLAAHELAYPQNKDWFPWAILICPKSPDYELINCISLHLTKYHFLKTYTRSSDSKHVNAYVISLFLKEILLNDLVYFSTFQFNSLKLWLICCILCFIEFYSVLSHWLKHDIWDKLYELLAV